MVTKSSRFKILFILCFLLGSVFFISPLSNAAIINFWDYSTGVTSPPAQGSDGTFSVVSIGDNRYAARFNPSASTGEHRFGLWLANGAPYNFNLSEASVWVKFKIDTADNCTILKFLVSGTSDRFEVRLTDSGQLQLYNDTIQLASNSVQVSLGVWHKLDMRIKVSATAGELEARLDGEVFASGVGIDTGTVNIIQLRLGAMDTANSTDIYFKSGVLSDDGNNYPPNGEFASMRPNDAGTYSDQTTGTYVNADETPITNSIGDALRFEGNTNPSEKFTANHDAPVISPNTIHGVMAWASYNNDSSNFSTQLFSRSETTNNTTTVRTAIGDKYSVKLYLKNPDNNAAWEGPDLDGLQVGMQFNNYNQGNFQQYLYACGALVFYTRDVNVVGKSDHPNGIGNPPQIKVFTDGYHSAALFYSGNGSATQPRIAFSTADDDIWEDSLVPGVSTVDRGNDLTFNYLFKSYALYQIYHSGITPRALSIFKKNRSFEPQYMSSGTTVSDITNYPSIEYDGSNRAWIAGQGSGEIRVKNTEDEVSFTLQSPYTTIHTLTGSNGSSQLVSYSNGEMGILYSDDGDNILRYKHYDGVWGAAETIATDLNWHTMFRGCVTQNDVLMVIYQEVSTTNIKYRKRALGGSFGTEGDMATDRSGGYISLTANMGKNEEAIGYYFDGTDLVKTVWDGSSWFSKTTLVSSPLLQGNINAPSKSVGQVTLLYHTTDGYIRSVMSYTSCKSGL